MKLMARSHYAIVNKLERPMPSDQSAPCNRSVPLRRITLEERLAMCQFELPISIEEQEWERAPPVGREWGGNDEASMLDGTLGSSRHLLPGSSPPHAPEPCRELDPDAEHRDDKC